MMTNPFRTPDDYELFLYTIPDQYPDVVCSTVTFVRIGMTLARVSGDITCAEGYRLVIRERLLYRQLPMVIDSYGYEVWKGDEKQYWYDSQPHPDDVSLQRTDPHHKHIHPDIKHHRIPAPDMRFDTPNIPFLIREIIALIKQARV